MFQDDFARLLNGLKAACPPVSGARKDENDSIEKDFALNESRKDNSDGSQTIVSSQEEDAIGIGNSQQIAHDHIRHQQSEQGEIAAATILSEIVLEEPAVKTNSSTVTSENVNKFETLLATAASGTKPPKKPTLRFHEAEDVGDSAFLAAWERKVDNLITSSLLQSDIDTELKKMTSPSLQSKDAQVTQTVVMEEHVEKVISTNESETSSTVNRRSQRIIEEIDELRSTHRKISVQDAVLLKVLESVPKNNGNEEMRTGSTKNWTLLLVFTMCLVIVMAAVAYQYYNTLQPHASLR